MTWSYPTIPEHVLQRLAADAVRNELTAPDAQLVDSEVVVAGAGPMFDVSKLAGFDDFVEKTKEASRDKNASELGDWVEGCASAAVLDAVEGLSILGLDDPGFWRYVSLRYLWNFVVWREAKAFGKAVEYEKGGGEDELPSPLGYRVYVDGRRPAECVPLRMYLRARIARDGGDPEAAKKLEAATDFWRSHVVRVRTGTAPVLSTAFVEYQAEHEMVTDDLRDFARRLNRLWSNVQLWSYDDPDDCANLLNELGG